ncbi:hypothetical protein RsTz2092_02570 [Deferribacterales bacterium RsTz2092]|nr:hypothetical protein AGMMS49941_08590 [Deferribacterales bacterium]
MANKNLIIKCLCIILLAIVSFACNKKPAQPSVDNSSARQVTMIVESVIPEISAGNELFLKGDFHGAISHYEQGLKQNRAVAYYNMGVSYYMTSDIVSAENCFRNAVVEDPSFDEAVMNLVAVLAEQEKTVEAENYLSRLVNKQKSARVYIDMANISIKNNNSAKAKYYYEKALSIDNTSDFVLSNYANYLVSIGELDEGERILELLEPKDFAVLYNLAYISWTRGDKGTAFDRAMLAFNQDQTSDEGNNKLATLFAEMKRYDSEAETLRRLIIWNPKKEYRLRLIESYLHNLDVNRAEDEASHLLSDYPSDSDAIVAYYGVMIARGRVSQAGNYIRSANSLYPYSEQLFYQLVRHICLYESNPLVAQDMLTATNADSPFVNLARVALYSRMMNLSQAEAMLARVPVHTSDDYFIYKSFLLFKQGDMRAAEKMALQINETKAEYFWYNFAVAWNLHNSERVSELLNNYVNDQIITLRVPQFNFTLLPLGNDMPFVYKFDNTPTDVAGMLLYPFFVEPDEMYQFLATGYKMVKNNDADAALGELERSLAFSEGVRQNNTGVENVIKFNFDEAMHRFKGAEVLLKSNAFVYYNIGLMYYFDGDMNSALTYFNNSISQNSYMSPAHLGRGLALERMGDIIEAKGAYSAAISSADEYLGLTSQHAGQTTNMLLTMIKQAKYLAFIALNVPDKVIAEADNDTNPNNYTKGIRSLAQYMVNRDERHLREFGKSPLYRSKELQYLIELSTKPASGIVEHPSDDLYTVMSAKYIMAQRRRTLSDMYISAHLDKKRVKVAMVNLATLLHDKPLGIRHLQELGRADMGYVPQYKAALYFFLWTRDFVNAEATLGTLLQMKQLDKESTYYMLLYYLINHNAPRLDETLPNYTLQYPWDYRSLILTAAKQLKDENYREFLSQITSMMEKDPFLFDKMPLALDIERF